MAAWRAVVLVQAIFLLYALPHCVQVAQGASCDSESWNELSSPGGALVVTSGQNCSLHMGVEALEGHSSLLVHLIGSSPSEARNSAVYCSTASCALQQQLFLEAPNRMLVLDQFPEGIYIHVSNTQGGVSDRDIRLEWAAVQANDACLEGQEFLVLRTKDALTTSDSSSSSAYFADCISKAASDQQVRGAQQSEALGAANGFWVSDSTGSNAGAAGGGTKKIVGFSYTWNAGNSSSSSSSGRSGSSSNSADMMGGREGGSMMSLLGPGQLPPAFITHGFTALASSQQGIIGQNLPIGSYRLEFDVTEGANFDLSLVFMQTKTMASYQSKNGREARNLQLEANDLDMIVVAFSVPASIPNGSCSFTLFHTGPLQKQDEVLKQIDEDFRDDKSVARITMDLVTGEVEMDIPDNGELNREQPASSKSPHHGLSKLSAMGDILNSQVQAGVSLMGGADSASRKLAAAVPSSPAMHVHALRAAPRLTSRGVHGISKAEGEQQQQQQLAADLLMGGASWGSWLVGLLVVAVISTAWLAWNGTTRASWLAKPSSLGSKPLALPKLHTAADCSRAQGHICPDGSQPVSPLLLVNNTRSQFQPFLLVPPSPSAALQPKCSSVPLPSPTMFHRPSPISSPRSDAVHLSKSAALKPFAASPLSRSNSTPELAFPPSSPSQHHTPPSSISFAGSPHYECPTMEDHHHNNYWAASTRRRALPLQEEPSVTATITIPHHYHNNYRAASTRRRALPLQEEPSVTATITIPKLKSVKDKQLQHHVGSIEESKEAIGRR